MKQNRQVEDYLKVIYLLQQSQPVRGVDLARELGVSKPTVSVALRKMESAGLVTALADRGVALTEEGARAAQDVVERNRALYGLLTDLGVEEQVARDDACRMEHGLSDASLQALNGLRRFLRSVGADDPASGRSR